MEPIVEDRDEEALRQELRQARERVSQRVADLRAIDREFEELETDRARYRLVQDACGALDELSDLGGGELFWSGSEVSTDGADHMRLVRGRIDAFLKLIDEVEDRRQSILEEIEAEEEHADFIAGDVLEAERMREQKEFEWEIEREVDLIPIRPSIMPFSSGGEDDQRFRRALVAALFVSLLIGFILPLVNLPVPERWEMLKEQDRLTQLIREELPPPVEIKQKQQIVQEELAPKEKQDAPQIAEANSPKAVPAPAAQKKDTASRGILAFREKFSSLATNSAVDRLGLNARIKDSRPVAKGTPTRSMVTTQAAGSSGGINVAALSRDTGGTGESMGGVAVTQATSSIGTGGGSDRPLAGGGPGLTRTDEEIQIVFDRHKAALYRLYNRALRQNPTLKGQIVLRMTIEPDGMVSLCELKSTDMKAPKLADQVVGRVKTFDFGAKEGIPAVTIVYPIDFLPAA